MFGRCLDKPKLNVVIATSFWRPPKFTQKHMHRYPPTPADARGSALGNNAFDSCFGLQS